MSNKEESENKKKRKYTMCFVHDGVQLEVDKICTKESARLRFSWGYKNYNLDPFKIKTNILEKALDFCKKRAEIRINHCNDKKLLKKKLEDFDSDFLKQMQTSHDDAIDLIDVAGKLSIKSLFDLLFEDVVPMIAQKTPEDIEKIFEIRHNGDDDRLNNMNFAMDCAHWPSKLSMLINQVI